MIGGPPRRATTREGRPQSVQGSSSVADLLMDPIGAGDVRARVPAAPGLYAWCASPAVLPALSGPSRPSIPDLRLLYVGIHERMVP